jgi:hypothetical protein
MPTVITEGTLAARAYGFGASSGAKNYIENVFSTYLYTGTGFTAGQSIANGINLSGKGGLVWIKDRTNVTIHYLNDTVNGAGNFLRSNQASSISNDPLALTSFNANGFSLGLDTLNGSVNVSPDNYASWTFRKQAKFFDIVTYTGTGSNRTIAHNLGSAPGCIMVKRTDSVANWQVYHSGLTSAAYSLQLNLDVTQSSSPTVWNSTAPTSSVFSVGTDASVNASGGTYVAYLFASNAGGFGNAGTDNVITCGSYTTDGSGNATVTLGYEPQWVLIKESTASATYGWLLLDTMRGWSVANSDAYLQPNTSAAESTLGGGNPTATGFVAPTLVATSTYIYIAIRRGPMATPTTGTSVFSPVYQTFSGTTVTNTGFVVDAVINKVNAAANGSNFVLDRLRGSDNSTNQQTLTTDGASSETASGTRVAFTGSVTIQNGFLQQNTNSNDIVLAFARAPNFFDEVCYTGTGSATTQTHNLGVIPELMIVKERSAANNWQVYAASLGNTQYLVLNATNAVATGSTRWNNTTPTSSVFSIGTDTTVNASTQTYVAYLFATCPGVSKVGSYSGIGATQTIDCGFTGGARFVMIKRTDTTGDWYVWDTARGMVSGTDPSLLLNSTAAQVNANSVYTTSVGFQIVSTVAGINASGGTYIFLAIA